MKKEKNIKESLKELLPYIIILLVVIFIKTFIVSPIKVNGVSMMPTLNNKDIMILDEVSYRFKEIKRFDIIVIRYEDEYLIKRVIGLPGEKVSYENDKLYINEKYVKENFTHKKTDDFEEIEVSDNKYFVMGDNRTNSTDSRIIGLIDRSEIKGKTAFTILPFNRFGNKK